MDLSDEQDFEAFVRAQTARLFRTAYLLTGDYQRAEDLLQVTFTKVYQRWHRVRAMDQPGAFARRILVNEASSWRRRRRVTELPLGDRDLTAAAPDVDESHRVWNAVLRLPPRQRAVMVLRYYEDLTEAEIAITLGMAAGTVKSHAHAAGRTLARDLAMPADDARTGRPR